MSTNELTETSWPYSQVRSLGLDPSWRASLLLARRVFRQVRKIWCPLKERQAAINSKNHSVAFLSAEGITYYLRSRYLLFGAQASGHVPVVLLPISARNGPRQKSTALLSSGTGFERWKTGRTKSSFAECSHFASSSLKFGATPRGARSRPAEWCHLDRSILNAMTIMP